MERLTESGLAVIERAGRSTMGMGSAMSVPLPVPTVQPWAGWPQAAGWQVPNWGGRSQLAGYVSTVYTCVDLNSRQLGSFPTYRMRGTQQLDDLPWMSNPCPELYTDWTSFMKQLSNTRQLRGEAFVYALARYSDGSVAQMCVIDPDAVDIDVLDGVIDYRIGGMPVDRADVLHIPYQTWPGELRGITPLQWIGRNLYAADALETYGAQLAANGAVPWGVLTTPANLTAQQVDENRDRWNEAAARRGAAPVMLSGGLTLETLTLSPTDMALLDLRVFDEQRICAAFGVPPYLVGLPQSEGLTYANASSLFDYHWRATLRPTARAIAAAISAWALPVGQRIEFNSDEYVRGDLTARAAAYSVLHGIEDETGRAITVAEIRQAERLSPPSGPPNAGAVLTGPVTGLEGTAA